jgi:hypothetical protein
MYFFSLVNHQVSFRLLMGLWRWRNILSCRFFTFLIPSFFGKLAKGELEVWFKGGEGYRVFIKPSFAASQ